MKHFLQMGIVAKTSLTPTECGVYWEDCVRLNWKLNVWNTLMKNIKNNWNSKICGEFFLMFFPLNFKGSKSKSKRNSKMWWNGTQNIYILIFMVLCIYGSFPLSHLLAFKPFLGSLFPPKCTAEGSFELGRGGVCEKSGHKICLSTPILNSIFCVFSPSWSNMWA